MRREGSNAEGCLDMSVSITSTGRSVRVTDTQLGGYILAFPNIRTGRWEIWKVTPYYEYEYRARRILVCGLYTYDYESRYPSRSLHIEVMYCKDLDEYTLTNEFPIPTDIYTAYLMGRTRTVARWVRQVVSEASEYIGRWINEAREDVRNAIEEMVSEYFHPMLIEYENTIGEWVTSDPYILSETWYGEYCHGTGTCNDIELVTGL